MSKPAGETYATFIDGMEGVAVWQRQLVLGPAPEFCINHHGAPEREPVILGGLVDEHGIAAARSAVDGEAEAGDEIRAAHLEVVEAGDAGWISGSSRSAR